MPWELLVILTSTWAHMRYWVTMPFFFPLILIGGGPNGRLLVSKGCSMFFTGKLARSREKVTEKIIQVLSVPLWNRYRDLAGIPPRFPELTGIPPRWPVFPAGSFPGKVPAAYLSKNPTEKSVLAGIPPRKKLFSRIPARILPGSKILIAFAART